MLSSWKPMNDWKSLFLSARPLGIKPVHQSTFGKDWGY
jgi:hypothetical protein